VSGPAYAAAVVEIVVEPGSDPAHRHGVLNEFVLPELRALPGYVKSLWLENGGGAGMCIVVFEEASQARAGLDVLTRDGGPPTIRAGIHEVGLEDPPTGSLG
jgi:hypothetical protein